MLACVFFHAGFLLSLFDEVSNLVLKSSDQEICLDVPEGGAFVSELPAVVQF